MAPRRALARRAKRLIGYWRSETRTIRQGLVALVLSTAAGFVAGLTLAHLTGTLASLPGLIILIPAAVGMKGTIFGAIGARLGTASAAGLPVKKVRKALKVAGKQLGAATKLVTKQRGKKIPADSADAMLSALSPLPALIVGVTP